ncbi:MAG: hypothetical protein ACYTG0_24655 [Planctomycetota bacterium]
MNVFIRLLSLAVVLWGTRTALPAGEAKGPATRKHGASVTVVELTLTPAAEPRPALKHRLLPPLLDRTPGNAAPLYAKAFLLAAQVDVPDDVRARFKQWYEIPPDQLPRDEIRQTVNKFDDVLHYVRMASRRTRCDWDLPFREETYLFATLLPELAGVRDVGRVLVLKARLAIAEGRYEDAVDVLQTGFSLARHCSRQPTIVSVLVGVSIAEMMAEQLQALVASPGAPNMYWAITTLPDPLTDYHEALEFEANGIYATFPELQETKAAGYTPQQWAAIFDPEALIARLGRTVESDPAKIKAMGEKLDQIIKRAHPIARQSLLARGYSPEKLDAMPPSQVVAIHQSAEYDELGDELFKWLHVPYWQGHKGLGSAEKKVAAVQRKAESAGTYSLAAQILPAVSAFGAATARVDRRFAELRCIEAVRLYAAARGGKLPDSLDDVRKVPIPHNPFTSKPFPYRRDGDTAILEAEGPSISLPRQLRLRVAGQGQ